ncbi:hypothetical protein [Litoreibacter halocynthiae]|uniref:hypothetical protein n=1 Tax=Litoreibacter halocynthiae TaxID=1242689 RepID=UPI001062ADC6|nr:hypothetical protein [Litoreibacter halocynthiae]
MFLVAGSGSAIAERYESSNLFAHKAWKVSLTYDTADNKFWCNAETYNRSGQTLSITAYDSGFAAVFFFDNRWRLQERKISFIVDIDYSRWTVDGKAHQSGISAGLNNGKTAGKFVGELAAGSAVALYNSNLARLATFSLSGSKAALLKLGECWNNIQKRDPFGASTDPF